MLNPIIEFLEGEWECHDTTIIPDEPPKEKTYRESMRALDAHTIEITAYGYDERDLFTKSMRLELDGEDLTMSQDGFKASGKFIGNYAKLVNDDYEGYTYHIRLALLDDIYVFQKDCFEEGVLVRTQMSYLRRLD